GSLVRSDGTLRTAAMKGDLYRRWLVEGRDLTLEEFVAERRAEFRRQRAQRRWAQHFGPLMQQAPPQMLLQQLVGLQNAPPGMYGGIPAGGLGNLLGGLLR